LILILIYKFKKFHLKKSVVWFDFFRHLGGVKDKFAGLQSTHRPGLITMYSNTMTTAIEIIIKAAKMWLLIL
jgi:hypothetical protein